MGNINTNTNTNSNVSSNIKVVPEYESNTSVKKNFFQSILLKTIPKKFILGIIDPQNDFFKDGLLAIENANEIIGPINKLRFNCFDYMETFISQDYHDPLHMSFYTTHNKEKFSKQLLDLKMEDGSIVQVHQDMWPVHCVKDTMGVNFHKDIITLENDKIFRKGTKVNVESYSAFGDENDGKYENTGLNKWLKSKNITDIILVGLATDFCVYNTSLDAIKYGYQVHLIRSCTRGVKPESTEKALEDLSNKGVEFYDDIDDFYYI